MATENSTNQDEQNYAQLQLAKLHMEAAHIINKAKRCMFERSREGTPLGKAAETFQQEVETGLLELIPGNMYADLDDLETDEHESPAAKSEEQSKEPQLRELLGNIRREVDSALRQVETRIGAGESPWTAYKSLWDAVSIDILNKYIPREEYGGLSLRQMEARAKAIVDDETKYNEETRSAISRAVKNRHISWAKVSELTQRAENGETLTEADNPKTDSNNERADLDTRKDWRAIKTIDDGEIEYLAKTIVSFDPDNVVEPLLLLIDAIEHDDEGTAGQQAKHAALANTETGNDLAEYYVKRLRSYFSREGNTSQPPCLENARRDLHDELERA